MNSRVIKVNPYFDAAIILEDGVNIDVSGEDGDCAFDMTEATVTLVLAGITSLKSGSGRAGIEAPAGSTLTKTSIEGSGSEAGTLNVSGGSGGAGIGGADGEITILGGTVSPEAGADIGGGSESLPGDSTLRRYLKGVSHLFRGGRRE
ncbi:MAG: hypothetical protein LBF80_02120 [Spirochaetaceae bacterium]|jgi:hypothetical protein|nr:hypothetical protein [Spirochaetaceae bacterium]